MSDEITSFEATIVDKLAEITDINTVLTYEPDVLKATPCMTLFFSGLRSEPLGEFWEWIMRLYISLKDAKTAQDNLKSIVPQVLDKVCSDSIFQINGADVSVISLPKNPLLMV